jgi:hypothetical protein
MEIPPYHPDLPEIRHDWAQFYDRITLADSLAGNILMELEDSGLEDSTIVVIYGDHGGILGRSKRFMYRTGLQVPMIVRVPEIYRHLATEESGSVTDRPVSFIDLAPTLLNLAGIEIPGHMQGRPFLGEEVPEPLPYVYTFRGRMDERYDFSRGTFTEDYHYVVNYMPHRIYAQHVEYLWRAPSMRAWEKVLLAGECNTDQSRFWQAKPFEELYDRKTDPWEVNNLAADPDYSAILEELRAVTLQWQTKIRDAGFIPEGMMKRYAGSGTIYDFVQSSQYPVEEIKNMAFLAAQRDPSNLPVFREGLTHENPVLRYWSVMGSVILKQEAEPMVEDLLEALRDSVPEIRIHAAEALCNLDQKENAIQVFRETLRHDQMETVLLTLNVIQALGKDALMDLRQDLQKVKVNYDNNYIMRAVDYALLCIDN